MSVEGLFSEFYDLSTFLHKLTYSRKIFDGTVNENNPAELEPVVQCVQVKPLGSQTNGPERFRIVFSDISNYVQSMLGTRKLMIEVKDAIAKTDSDA